MPDFTHSPPLIRRGRAILAAMILLLPGALAAQPAQAAVGTPVAGQFDRGLTEAVDLIATLVSSFTSDTPSNSSAWTSSEKSHGMI